MRARAGTRAKAQRAPRPRPWGSGPGPGGTGSASRRAARSRASSPRPRSAGCVFRARRQLTPLTLTFLRASSPNHDLNQIGGRTNTDKEKANHLKGSRWYGFTAISRDKSGHIPPQPVARHLQGVRCGIACVAPSVRTAFTKFNVNNAKEELEKVAYQANHF